MHNIRPLNQWTSSIRHIDWLCFMLDVHWFNGLMLCICSLCHFVCLYLKR